MQLLKKLIVLIQDIHMYHGLQLMTNILQVNKVRFKTIYLHMFVITTKALTEAKIAPTNLKKRLSKLSNTLLKLSMTIFKMMINAMLDQALKKS